MRFWLICRGEFTAPFTSVYAVTKHGLRAYTDALRRELAPWNIYVGVIEPGYYKYGFK